MHAATHFSKSLESALRSIPTSPHGFQRWVKFCLSYIEYTCPAKISLETGRMIKLLAEHPMGLKREELLEKFYENYANASMNRQESLRICLEKVIQRTRVSFSTYNLTITYCSDTKRYFISPCS